MLDQIGIALTGCIAIWLSQDARASHRRWACIFGLIGQPFWFYAAWQAGQWGIFALSFIYTASWMKGLWNNWLAPAVVDHRRAQEKAELMDDAVHPNEAAFNAEFKAFNDRVTAMQGHEVMFGPEVPHSPLSEASDPRPSIFMLQAALNASREHGEIEGTGLYLLPHGYEMFAAERIYQAMTAEAKS